MPTMKAPRCARLLDQRHEVDVGIAGVDAPEHDEIGVHHLLGVVARHRAHRGHPARVGGADADGPVELGRAQGMEERVTRPVLDKPQSARVREGQDGLAAPLGDDAAPPMGDLLDGGVPAHPLEAPLALGAHAPERREDARGSIESLRVVVNLAADDAAGEGMRRVAGHRGDPALLHGDGERALRRAIVGTDGVPSLTHRGHRVAHVVWWRTCRSGQADMSCKYPGSLLSSSGEYRRRRTLGIPEA